jgi:hypothetical protein
MTPCVLSSTSIVASPSTIAISVSGKSFPFDLAMPVNNEAESCRMTTCTNNTNTVMKYVLKAVSAKSLNPGMSHIIATIGDSTAPMNSTTRRPT